MLDAVVDEIDGRRIRVGDQWLADFGSCNYLGFDLEPEIIAAIPDAVAQWGTHPSWSRILASPALYEQIEVELADLLGAEDALALPTITHIHAAVIPLLTGGGTLYLDRKAHKTIYDGSSLAKARGTTVHRFRHNDLDHLEELLGADRRAGVRGPRVIATDGVNSMTGNVPDLAALAALAREYDALLYVDDAHGFGVIGEPSVDDLSGYGRRGNSIVRHFDETYDNVVLVGGFSKAYSSLLAFIACPTPLKNALKVAAPPYAYSGPSPVASLATVLAGLRVNEARGDEIRADLARKTRRVLTFLDAADIYTPNESGFPIIQIPLADPERIDELGAFLFERGIYITMAAYPIVPRNEVGVRIQVTAANTDDEISHLIDVLAEVADRFPTWTRDAWTEASEQAAAPVVALAG
ncbi:MAG: aminotransferase class I/II-fold pyridoxal phosphate-dependent enzyme [Acidimicrobiales bacterium]